MPPVFRPSANYSAVNFSWRVTSHQVLSDTARHAGGAMSVIHVGRVFVGSDTGYELTFGLDSSMGAGQSHIQQTVRVEYAGRCWDHRTGVSRHLPALTGTVVSCCEMTRDWEKDGEDVVSTEYPDSRA